MKPADGCDGEAFLPLRSSPVAGAGLLGERRRWPFARPMTTTPMDIVPFLKALSWLRIVLCDALGENPYPLDRAVVALRCSALPEGTALEFMVRHSTWSLRGGSFMIESSVDSNRCSVHV